MSRLPRPSIPLDVDLRVILRQLGEPGADDIIEIAKEQRSLGTLRNAKLAELAKRFGCEAKGLELDHDPALVNREKLVELPTGYRRRVIVVPKGRKVLRYFPDANDPEYLRYRPKATEFDGSHAVKTRVRGDHGQLSDLGIARKNKRRAKKLAAAKSQKKRSAWPKGRKIPSRPFQRRRK